MADEIEIKNAVIVDICPNPVDMNGTTSLYITLDFGNSSRCFLGYRIYGPLSFVRNENPSTFSEHTINRILEIANSSHLNELIGKMVRVKFRYSRPIMIGHIVEDDWFDPKEEFKTMKGGD